MGGYEPNPMPWAERGIPEGFHFQLLDADWDHFEPMMELALGRVPALRDRRHQAAHQRPGELHARRQLHPRRGAGGRRLLRRRRLQRLRHRLGRRRRHGARRMGGQRRAALRPLAGRHPPLRPQPPSTPTGCATRTLEAYAKHYTMAWPFEEYASGRPLRRSPLYDRLKAQGAVLRREARLGAAELVRRPRGEAAARRLHLRPAELVRGGRPRAPRLPRGGGAVRPDLVRQVPDGRAATPRRRSPGSAPTTSPGRRARSPTRRC